VVSQDEKEAGLRAILNYGHTIGHVVESLTGYRRLNHGEAVAIGMEAAGRIALELGFWDEASYQRQQSLLHKTGLPTRLPTELDVDAMVAALQTDKKVMDGQVRFILPRAIGQVQITDDVPNPTIRHVLKTML
jgi:3-dehydroquinate synthase